MSERLNFKQLEPEYMRWIASRNGVTVDRIANELEVSLEDIGAYDDAVSRIRSYNRRTESGSAGSDFELDLTGVNDQYNRVARAMMAYSRN